MLYEGEFASIASDPGMLERTILLDGLSKTYAMTGWRCGFAAVPEPLVDPLMRFFVNSTSCVPPFVQLAGMAALTARRTSRGRWSAEFRRRRDARRRRASTSSRASPAGRPRGAFYAFPNVARFRSPPRSSPPAARRSRRRRPRGHRVRAGRQGQPPTLVRELAGEPHPRARADARAPGNLVKCHALPDRAARRR